MPGITATMTMTTESDSGRMDSKRNTRRRRLYSLLLKKYLNIIQSMSSGTHITVKHFVASRDLCKTHCSKFAHFIIFLYLYSMKQRPSSPSFADLIVGHRKVKQTFFLQIDQIIDWNPIRGLIEIA